MSNQCMYGSWYVNQTLIYIWLWFVLLFHFTVFKKTWALTAHAAWVAWCMSWVVSWPCCITANRPCPASPAPRTLGNAVKSDKWHLRCHRPLFFCSHRGDMCTKVILDVARPAENRLIYGYWGSYTTASWFDVYWTGCLPDSQHCLMSQRLPTELFSSAPFLHGAIFLVF